MTSDRHVVLRILAQAATPLTFLIGLASAAFLLAVVLASPQQAQAWLVRLGLASEIAPAALAAQAFGVAAVACIVSAGVLMLQAIGARAQPLSIEDLP